MKDENDEGLALEFPVEIVIRETPRSFQSPNSTAKEAWKRRVGDAARDELKKRGELFFLDERPLALTIFYFSPHPMQGDIDNVIKLIVDGMIGIVYLNDRALERITVQKFEPETNAVIRSIMPGLARAATLKPPVVYIRIDDDLSWREIR